MIPPNTKPCPFCGSMNLATPPLMSVVVCGNCNCAGPPAKWWTRDEGNVRRAFEKWNKRIPFTTEKEDQP